jgi:hypothetical protein
MVFFIQSGLIKEQNMKYQIRKLFINLYDIWVYDDNFSDPIEISKEVFDFLRSEQEEENKKRKDVWAYIHEGTPFQIRAVK